MQMQGEDREDAMPDVVSARVYVYRSWVGVSSGDVMLTTAARNGSVGMGVAERRVGPRGVRGM